MIKIKIDSFLLFDVDRKTVFIFKNRYDYELAIDMSSRFRKLNDDYQFLPVHLVDNLYYALKNRVAFYLVSVGSQIILIDWEIARRKVVLTDKE